MITASENQCSTNNELKNEKMSENLYLSRTVDLCLATKIKMYILAVFYDCLQLGIDKIFDQKGSTCIKEIFYHVLMTTVHIYTW